jgi:hypothetical protein
VDLAQIALDVRHGRLLGAAEWGHILPFPAAIVEILPPV